MPGKSRPESRRSPRREKQDMLCSARKILTLLFAGANVASVLLMWLCAMSATVRPDTFRLLVPFGLTFPFYLATNVFFLLLWAVFSPRFIWISIAGLAASFSAVRTYCPVNLPDPHPQGCIKVMSYNVKGFCITDHDEGRDGRLDDMLRYLRSSGADIVCLQEYQFWPDERGAKVAKVRNHWPYHDSIHIGTNALGFWSRYPIIRRQRVPFHADCHGGIAYTLKLPAGDTVMVINNHFVSNAISDGDKSLYKNLVKTPGEVNVKSNLGYLAGKIGRAGVRRAEQADSLVAFIGKQHDRPVIVCGDFNDSPISYAHHRMTETLDDAYTASGLGPGISYHEAGMYFRLDNILCSSHWKSYSAKVDSKMGCSDHYPIVCYLKLKKQ